jgi:hypothetical protein
MRVDQPEQSTVRTASNLPLGNARPTTEKRQTRIVVKAPLEETSTRPKRCARSRLDRPPAGLGRVEQQRAYVLPAAFAIDPEHDPELNVTS